MGYIDLEKNIFITHREESIHKFKAWNGLGFNKKLIERLNGKISAIWIFYHMENGETILLKTTTKTVLEQGMGWQNTSDLKDVQLILPLSDFERI